MKLISPVLSGLLAVFTLTQSAAATQPTFSKVSEGVAKISIGDLYGDWSFSTDFYRAGTCQMTGSMMVFRSEEDNVAECVLTATEVCGDERSVVEQTCELIHSGGTAYIDSQIENFIERKPNSLGYLPDNFFLHELAADEMNGQLESAVITSVVFRRSTGSIS